jgi:hypothetical protein
VKQDLTPEEFKRQMEERNARRAERGSIERYDAFALRKSPVIDSLKDLAAFANDTDVTRGLAVLAEVEEFITSLKGELQKEKEKRDHERKSSPSYDPGE